MTSRSLFSKLIWKDIKQRIWCPVLLCVVFFLSMEVACLMSFQAIDAYGGTTYFQTKLSYFRDNFLMVNSSGGMITFWMAVSAVLCGLSSFTYLNSKKRIDLYHSLPVHRNVLFFSRFVSGVICFVGPFLFNLCVTFLLALGKNAVDVTAAKRVFIFAGFHIIFFLSIYATTVLATMLTGNFVLNAIGTAVLLSYSPILWETIIMLNAAFFKTFVTAFFRRTFCLSPVENLVSCIAKIGSIRDYSMVCSYASAGHSLIIECIAIVVLILVDWKLFVMRPSEAAGKSIVFPAAEPVIKTAFLLPVSLSCGMFFMRASSAGNAFIWFLFGTIFGFFFIGIVIEIIYRLDIKCAFCHWKYLLLNLVVLVIIIVIYKFDLFGYDKFIPNKEHVESMSISIDNLDTQLAYNRYDSYLRYDEYRLENMKLTNIDVPYALCQEIVKHQAELSELQCQEVGSYDTTSEYIQARKENPSRYISGITIAYRQKNGKVIYRYYLLDMLDETTFALLNDIYCTEEYKKGVFPIFEGRGRQYYKLDCNMAYDTQTLKLDEEKMEEFLTIYREELLTLSLKQMRDEFPIGSIDLYEKYKSISGEAYNNCCGYPIYASFEKTIEWLKEQGVDYTKPQEPKKLLSVQVWNYNSCYETEEGWTDNVNVEYEDNGKMKKILEHCVNTYGLDLTTILPIDTSIEVDVQYENSEGSNFKTMYFKNDEIPDFVIQDMDAFEPEQDDIEEQTGKIQ